MTKFNPATMKDLVNCFEIAKEKEVNYVGTLVQMDGFPENEIIVNNYKNIDSKLKYYKATYDDNLNHKFAEGIRIIDFTYGYCFNDIEEDLLWD